MSKSRSSNGVLTQIISWRGLKRIMLATVAAVFLTIFVLAACSAPQNGTSPTNSAQTPSAIDWKPIEQALGKAGSMQPGDVYKVSLPRSDLKVTVGGVQLKPALALGSWVAFKKMGNEAMVMGDLVLTETEVSQVMFKLQQGGIEQSALHNHVLDESPRVMYMHIMAHGHAVALAETIHAVLA